MNATTTTLRQIKKAIENLEKEYKGNPLDAGNIPITFEYMVASFFPQAWENYEANLQKIALENFKNGYAQGLAESQNNLTKED